MSVSLHPGIPDSINLLTNRLPSPYHFLRASWYIGGDGESSSTLIGQRADGTDIVAIPTVGVGPTLIGARSVPGSYWPFRSALIAPDASEDELIAFFGHPATMETMGQMWRIGPVYSDDPAVGAIKHAAASAGWTVLVRRLGRAYLFDTASDWPRSSTRKRLANYSRQMALRGAIRFETVTGAKWGPAALKDLATIELASWVGRTDGTGAKFMADNRKRNWGLVLQDPVLADMLMATILYVDDKPIAFSFDLILGKLQYAIASSFDADYAPFRPGKIVTAHQLDVARAMGIETIDLGAGDSGYKREMGATRGPEILDLLIVRNRSAASLLKLKWGSESVIARKAYREASRLTHMGNRFAHRRGVEALLAAGALAAAAITFVE